ncbi:cellulose synthase-like protein H1 [Vitis riparia]|uniref:cellulose synthase-like protein H1 n=1 Tax=Vitis riparia TaxID=96939 RepID=UPI00155A5BE9|nr:cellulose synthase-like protein H1 [Vitis riparia]
MNVLTRVSGAMTNAPFMLNVDCDMYANNPLIFHHAMCLLLGSKNEQDCGFVQSPQCFYDGLKDDPFGNQLVVLYKYLGSGIVGLQGPTYTGTGCFHRRKVIYGLWPDGRMEIKGRSGMQSIYLSYVSF